jgi:hypothetical protein
VGKPGFYFYTGDWLKKTRLLTLGARGAWIDLLVLMDEQKPRGQVTLSLAQYAGYWNVSTEVAAGVILELELTRTANVKPSLSDASVTLQASRVTPRDFHVTIASRKMLRENNSRELHRLRQARYRVTHKSDARVTPPLPSPSPSLNLHSYKNKNEPEPASPEPSVDSKRKDKPELDPQVKHWAAQIYATDKKRYARLMTWITAALQHYNPAVVAASLERFLPYAAKVSGDWWPYLDRILDKTEAQRNARDSEAEAERFKRENRETLENLGEGFRKH